MAKTFNIEVDEHLKNKCDLFIKNIKSGMHYKADLDSNLNSLEWLEILEEWKRNFIERLPNKTMKSYIERLFKLCD